MRRRWRSHGYSKRQGGKPVKAFLRLIDVQNLVMDHSLDDSGPSVVESSQLSREAFVEQDIHLNITLRTSTAIPQNCKAISASGCSRAHWIAARRLSCSCSSRSNHIRWCDPVNAGFAVCANAK